MLLISYCATAIITSTVRREKEEWTAIIMKYHFTEETVRLSSRKNSFFHRRFPDFFPSPASTFLATRKRCPACLTFSPAGKFPAAEKHAALSTTRVLAEIYGRWCQDRAKIFTFRWATAANLRTDRYSYAVPTEVGRPRNYVETFNAHRWNCAWSCLSAFPHSPPWIPILSLSE